MVTTAVLVGSASFFLAPENGRDTNSPSPKGTTAAVGRASSGPEALDGAVVATKVLYFYVQTCWLFIAFGVYFLDVCVCVSLCFLVSFCSSLFGKRPIFVYFFSRRRRWGVWRVGCTTSLWLGWFVCSHPPHPPHPPFSILSALSMTVCR